jgi:hypothetical protein
MRAKAVDAKQMTIYMCMCVVEQGGGNRIGDAKDDCGGHSQKPIRNDGY